MPLPVLVTAYKDKSFEFVRARWRARVGARRGRSPPLRATRLQVVKSPPATYFIKKAAGACVLENATRERAYANPTSAFDTCTGAIRPGLVSGSQKPGHQIRSTISLKHVYEIAKVTIA